MIREVFSAGFRSQKAAVEPFLRIETTIIHLRIAIEGEPKTVTTNCLVLGNLNLIFLNLPDARELNGNVQTFHKKTVRLGSRQAVMLLMGRGM
jgi:hypothetical protein